MTNDFQRTSPSSLIKAFALFIFTFSSLRAWRFWCSLRQWDVTFEGRLPPSKKVQRVQGADKLASKSQAFKDVQTYRIGKKSGPSLNALEKLF